MSPCTTCAKRKIKCGIQEKVYGNVGERDSAAKLDEEGKSVFSVSATPRSLSEETLVSAAHNSQFSLPDSREVGS